MQIEQFIESLKAANPPAGLEPLLRALWHDAKGEWKRAHEIAQEVENRDGAWVHAYLHRKEGDLGNARYWYARARRDPVDAALDSEWREISAVLLGRI